MGMTEGVNLKACWNFGYGVVDLDRLYTNEIGETLKVYGVEAARTSIMKEISNVFGVYGIGVDGRHLTILADYMVRSSSLPVRFTSLTPHTIDERRSLQAIQSNWTLEQHLDIPQSFFRNDEYVRRRGRSLWRFRRSGNAICSDRAGTTAEVGNGRVWCTRGGGGLIFVLCNQGIRCYYSLFLSLRVRRARCDKNDCGARVLNNGKIFPPFRCFAIRSSGGHSLPATDETRYSSERRLLFYLLLRSAALRRRSRKCWRRRSDGLERESFAGHSIRQWRDEAVWRRRSDEGRDGSDRHWSFESWFLDDPAARGAAVPSIVRRRSD